MRRLSWTFAEDHRLWSSGPYTIRARVLEQGTLMFDSYDKGAMIAINGTLSAAKKACQQWHEHRVMMEEA